MPLEKFFSGENINIKDLTIETPERQEEGLPFDPEKEMTEEDWKKIKEHLESIHLNASAPDAAMLMQTYPEKAREFGAETVAKELQKDGEKILEEYEHGKRGTTRWGVSDLLYGMKILAPELFRKVATPERMERCAQSLLRKEHLSGSSVDNVMNLLEARTLVPQTKLNAAIKEFQLWEEAQKEIHRVMQNDIQRTYPFSLLKDTARARLLFPKRFAELGIDDEARKDMKKEFQEAREKSRHYPQNRETFLNEAVALKILAAEEIKFAEDGGIEIIMQKPKSELQSETPPMPEKRNF